MNILQVGCGGIGGWLALYLAKHLTAADRLILVDGDTVEEHNFDRQFFHTIGVPKAQELSCFLGTTKCCIDNDNRFFTLSMLSGHEPHVIVCAVDNHAARRMCLRAGDMDDIPVIIGANDTLTAEAYIYRPEWVGTKLDPRIFYPVINTDNSNDPTDKGMSCQSPVMIERYPQLPLANMMAANMMAVLFNSHVGKTPEDYTPIGYYSNGNMYRNIRSEDR